MTGITRDASRQALRDSLAVVMKHYIKPSTEAGERGLKLLEATVTKASKPATKS